MSGHTPTPVQQDWVLRIPLMQQTVLLTAIRGPDGVRKNHPVKCLLRWFRRSVLLSAMDGKSFVDPFEKGGGSFTGPFTRALAAEYLGEREVNHHLAARPNSWSLFNKMPGVYLDHVDELPHHFQLHFMHAAQIIGAHHDNEQTAQWWRHFYLMLVNDMHLHPETDEEMNLRLSDNEEQWRARENVGAGGA